MLRIEIFDKLKPKKTPTLMLNTRVTPDGAYEVFACDRDGDPLVYGKLWVLFTDGRQLCPGGISDALGLDLIENDRIRNV